MLSVVDLRVTAADKLFNNLRAQSARRRQKALQDLESSDAQYTHELDDIMPVKQYMIKKDALGNDVYKRRTVIKNRVKKERSDSYFEKRKRALSARAAKIPDDVREAEERRQEKLKNMFSNFAANYEKTLKKLVDQTAKY